MGQKKDSKDSKDSKESKTPGSKKTKASPSPKIKEEQVELDFDSASDAQSEAAEAKKDETPTWVEEAEAAGEVDANTYSKNGTSEDDAVHFDTKPDSDEAHAEEKSDEQSSDSSSQQTEAHLHFPYSEMLRAYAPDAMKVADKVATDWKNEGSFSNLGIENPYANMAVSLGLQKAKELEKKLEEKGVLSAVRMGFEVLKQQVNKRK